VSDLPRLFIAVPIEPTPGLREVAEELDRLGKPVRCVRLDQLHVTLKFLGPTRADVIPQVDRVLREAVQASSAESLTLCSLGVFPSRQHPRVVWAGIDRRDPLAQIAARLDTGLSPLGVPRENRDFTPHVTLAFLNGPPPRTLLDLLDANATRGFGASRLDRVVLYRSDLSPSGPTYTELASHNLPI